MFSTLRQGAAVYILDKGENPQLKIGQVESVSIPQPRISIPNYTGMAFSNETTIDIKVKVDNETLEFQKIPTNLSIASLGNLVIGDNRDDMLTAVDAFMQNSRQILDNIDYHKKVVEACDGMLIQLSPAYAKDKERDSAIEGMKSEMAEIRGEFRGAISEIKNLLSLYVPKQPGTNSGNV